MLAPIEKSKDILAKPRFFHAMSDVVIRCQDLTKYYGESRGIENLNLEVREGEVFGFLGPNGAGKTTLFKILLGLLRPSAGTARIALRPLCGRLCDLCSQQKGCRASNAKHITLHYLQAAVES